MRLRRSRVPDIFETHLAAAANGILALLIRDVAATLALDVAVEHRAPGIPGLRLGTARKRGYANRRRDRKYENRSHCGTLRTVAPGFLRRNESRTSHPGQQGNEFS